MTTFQKMCDCKEIQDGWEPKVGDAVYCKELVKCINMASRVLLGFDYSKEPTGFVVGNISKHKTFLRDELIYKPREEDLWRMLPEQKLPYKMLYSKNRIEFQITYPLGSYLDKMLFIEKTAKEALIQGVMWELHGKRWERGGWK